MMEITNIFLGFKNLIFKNKKVEKSAENKLKKCFNCPLRDSKTCSKEKQGEAVKTFIYKGEKRVKGKIYKGCGCSLELKSRSSSICPLGKF